MFPPGLGDSTSKRFENRVNKYKRRNTPVRVHHFWWFVHNCIAHPLIGIFPCRRTFAFHDYTSDKINHITIGYTKS